MAYYILTLLGITSIIIIWMFILLKKECDNRKKEKEIVQTLSHNIEELRNDINDLKK